ncbi:MAG: beta-eliminating lyase-related protein, partial [Pseudomonadota bacterium]
THEYSHIHLDECGAPEFFSNGAKLIPLSGEDGKLSPTDLDTALDFYLPTELRRVTPKVISLTQASEVGTVYTVDELKILVKYAHDHGLKVHMDGARLANACAAMNVSLAAVTNEVGIDVVTLGATKNGCMIAEAVIFLNLDLAAELAWRQKRAGQSFSKQRYLSAQWLAYFENDLWLNLARHANTQALTLAEGLKAQGFSLGYPQHINEVFVQMDQHIADQMRAKGYQFYDWKLPGDPFKGKLKRFVTNFETSPQLINDFLDKLKSFS